MDGMKRDPRINPKRGDALQKGTVTREVRDVGPEWIIVVDSVWGRTGLKWKAPTLLQFRKWARKAGIVV
jgi:hypothetical protein